MEESKDDNCKGSSSGSGLVYLFNEKGIPVKVQTTPKRHTNVLMNMIGYFKEKLSSDEKKELLEVIENYRKGFIPLIVPITLIKHYVHKYNQLYLKEQIYLHPHSLELQMKYHI